MKCNSNNNSLFRIGKKKLRLGQKLFIEVTIYCSVHWILAERSRFRVGNFSVDPLESKKYRLKLLQTITYYTI